MHIIYIHIYIYIYMLILWVEGLALRFRVAGRTSIVLS